MPYLPTCSSFEIFPMSWPLSHTADAYEYASYALRALSRRKLQDAAIGWKAELRKRGELSGYGFNVRTVPFDSLADFVEEHALGEYGRCSNGGHELYVDPDGFITVPFGPDDE